MDKNSNADQLEIIYYTDPLCCWSWGFEPQWRRLLLTYDHTIKWRYCMGGLLPSWKNFVDPINFVNRPAQMGPIWMEASHMTGMPIESTIWIHNPPISSYPACIAVKAAEMQSLEAGALYLRLAREAVMLKMQDISSLDILLHIAKNVSELMKTSFDFYRFQQDIHSEEALEAFRKDMAEVRSKNISRFPTLIFKKHGKPSMIMVGYRPFEVVRKILTEMEIEMNESKATQANNFYSNYHMKTEREKKEIDEIDFITQTGNYSYQ